MSPDNISSTEYGQVQKILSELESQVACLPEGDRCHFEENLHKLREILQRQAQPPNKSDAPSISALMDRVQRATSIETVGILFFDLEGNITGSNDAFLRMAGYSREDLEKGPLPRWDVMTPPEFMPASRQAVEELRVQGESTPYEKQYIRKDGSRWWGLFAAKRLDDTEYIEFVLDITDRKETEGALRQSEAALRKSEAKQAFLLKLSDTLRPLADPVAIQAEAARVLGEHLGVTRVMYGEVAEDGEHLTVERNYVSDGAPLLIGRYRMADFGPALVSALNAGRTIVLPEIASAVELSAAEREAYATLGIAALIGVPLTKDNRFVVNLNIHQAEPRAWTADEVAIIEETAERTWAAVQRARAESALRESESRLREFLENTHDVYFALDREWHFTYANSRFGLLMRVNPKELIGKNIWELYPQYLGSDVEQHYRRVMTERIPVYFQQHGIYTQRFYDLSLYPTREGLVSFGSDRTEEWRRQQQAETERARLEAVLNGLPVGVWITVANGRIVGKNEQSNRIWAGDAPMSESWEQYTEYEMRYPDSGKLRPLEEYPLVRVLASGQPVEPQENLIHRFDGSYSFALVSASPIKNREGQLAGAVAIMLDISERKQAEMALKESEARFRSSIESLNVGFTIYAAIRDNGAIVDFRIEYANEMTCRLGRRTHDQVVGHTLLELFPHFREDGLFHKYIQVVETGQSLVEQAYAYADAPEMQPWLSGRFDVHAVKFGDGLIVTLDDVTEQVRLEKEHQQVIQERAIHHRLSEQREKERQSFARDIHDGPIQTLSSLAFSLQLLKEVYPDPKLQIELSEISLSVKGAVQELRQVMNELRPPNVLRFGLSKAIQVHVENLRERYPQINWELKLEDDEQRLEEQTCLAMFRIYQEAINNIIRHSEATQAWVQHRVFDDHTILEIRDNGKGFAGQQDIVTLTNNQHFGLAGISERVQAIQGQLEITSTPGDGTTIRVRAPILKP